MIASPDLYKADIQETRKDEYTPSFTKIENQLAKDSLVEYILSKPKESQVKDNTYQIMHLIGEMYPIADQDIKIYVERLVNKFNNEQINDYFA